MGWSPGMILKILIGMVYSEPKFDLVVGYGL